jgi:pyruvyltransferase
MGVGSIAGKLTSRSIIAGSGFIEPIKNNTFISPQLILSLRGELSAEILNTSPNFLGDPISLINLLLPESSFKKFDLGYIPHVSNYPAAKEFAKKHPSIYVINPGDSPLKVIDEITSCNRVASQSLHGLIVADAYNIPNIWIGPTKNMMGGTFKFRDYFSTLRSSKESFRESIFLTEFQSLDYSFSIYKYNKKDYLDFLRNNITQLLSQENR